MRTSPSALLAARAYRRYANLAPVEEGRASGGAAALRTDEVSRHAVRLVVIDRQEDHLAITKFARLPELLRTGDLVIVNDAATLPGSLCARTVGGEELELRLSAPVETNRLFAVAFGAGDHHTRTEDRPPPPPLAIGDVVEIIAAARPLFTAKIVATSGRRVELVTRETGDVLWQALYAAGAPVQYAHRPELLPLYEVQTAYAARPWAAEMPSAGRPLTWDVLLGLRRAGVELATLTHAAGLSSTGDDALDRALPWPERYEIPRRTVDAIARARAVGGRVIAVGTTVVRALESAAEVRFGDDTPLAAGSGTATLRLDGAYKPRVVDGLVSGLHAPGESHFDLLSAFAPRQRLSRAIELAVSHGLSSHELGDSCLIL